MAVAILPSVHMREFDVVVIGAGPAGLTAAKELAQNGSKVLLAERRPFLGGRLVSLGPVFPTMKEGRALALAMVEDIKPLMQDGTITVMLQTGIEALRQMPEGAEVDLVIEARHVNDRCAKCGDCAEECPVTVSDRWDPYGAEVKAIHVMHSGWPVRSIVDIDACTRCGRCLEACARSAIDLDEKDVRETVKAKAVVIATGLDIVDLSILPEFGTSLSKDVITSLQLERMMAANGPTQGRIMRPSDSQEPKVVVFAQCVGSRVEKRGVRYCCSVGCLNAVKNSAQIMERAAGSVAYVCYIDMRMHGRGYEEAYKDARTKGVRFIRGQPSIVRKEKDRLLVCGENTLLKELYEIPADLVVLCPGLEVPAQLRKVLADGGIAIDSDNLVHIEDDLTAPERTAQDRIFIAGSLESPKDLKDTLLHAKVCAQSVIDRIKG